MPKTSAKKTVTDWERVKREAVEHGLAKGLKPARIVSLSLFIPRQQQDTHDLFGNRVELDQ
jgi:hypothetical protein